jgi:hypothetical protein
LIISIDGSKWSSLAEIRALLAGAAPVQCAARGPAELFRWLQQVLVRYECARLGKRDKGGVRCYAQKLTGLSRAQLTRLIAAYQRLARIEVFARSARVVPPLAALRPAALPFPAVWIATPWESRLGCVGNADWADHDLHVPAEAVNTLVPIELDVSCTWIPARDIGSADTSVLGVAVSIGPDRG